MASGKHQGRFTSLGLRFDVRSEADEQFSGLRAAESRRQHQRGLALRVHSVDVGSDLDQTADGGRGAVAGPGGGYIGGCGLAGALGGYVAERGWDRNVGRTAVALFLGNVVLYVPGLIWLALFYAGPGRDYIAATGANTAWGASINAGLLPFLLGDALKLALAATLVPAIWTLLHRRQG